MIILKFSSRFYRRTAADVGKVYRHTLNKKKILLLGGSAQQIVAIETAKRLGLYTILCDYLPDNPGQFHADKFYLISTTDQEAVLKVAEAEQIDGVLAYASDPAAPTAAYVAERLGLPGNPYRSVGILCNKDRFRAFLTENGFSTPQAKFYNDREDAIRDLNTFKFPLIIKPVDSSGSKGTSVLRNPDDSEAAIDFAFSFSRSKRIIIEEYIEKKHPYLIGGDIFVHEGKIILWGLMNCHRDASVNPLVPVGKSFPLQLSESDTEHVKKVLQLLVKALGIRSGEMNVELLIDNNNRVIPIDIGPRSGGNMIPDLLSLIYGLDLIEMCVRAAMGEKNGTETEIPEPAVFYASHNLHGSENGHFEDVFFSDEIKPFIIRKNIYLHSGDPVRKFSNASDAVGIILMRFPDKETMFLFLNNIDRHIKISMKEKMEQN